MMVEEFTGRLIVEYKRPIGGRWGMSVFSQMSLRSDDPQSVTNVKISIRIKCLSSCDRDGLLSCISLKWKEACRKCRNFYVLKLGQYTYILFRYGADRLFVNVTGLPSLHYIDDSYQSLNLHLKSLIHPINGGSFCLEFSNPSIDSITSKIKIGKPINLLEVKSRFSDCKNDDNDDITIKCQLEKFPGVICRHRHLGTSILFSNGTLLFWGSKSLTLRNKFLELILQKLFKE